MAGHGPESLSAVLGAVWECQQRVEEFALPYHLAYEASDGGGFGGGGFDSGGFDGDFFDGGDSFGGRDDGDEPAPPGLHVQIDDAAGLPEIRMVKLLRIDSRDLCLVLRLQTPDDGYRVSAEILTDEDTVFSDERKTDSLTEALTDLRVLTAELCAHADTLNRQVAAAAH